MLQSNFSSEVLVYGSFKVILNKIRYKISINFYVRAHY